MKTELPHKLLTIGFLVNPIAGAGGPAAHKGSDLAITKESVAAGELTLRAPERAKQFLSALDEHNQFELISAPGAMGADYLTACPDLRSPNLRYRVLSSELSSSTSDHDTKRIVTLLMQAHVDLIVFVGGDGTARDVCSVLESGEKGETFPVLGVPSGVKMHSGVFAITPSAAAKVLNEVVSGALVSLVEQEVRDIDEQALQKNVVKSCYYGAMLVPDEVRYIQAVKSGGVEVDELVLADIAAEVAERIADCGDEAPLIIFATGSTTQFIQQEIHCPGTLLGVDVFKSGHLIAEDVTAEELEVLVSAHEGKVIIVLTAIGGQGHILGRGNQQLSPKVLRRVGRDNLWVVMTKTKLEALEKRPLLMDSNDPELDAQWQGLIPVITGYHDQVLYRLGSP